MSLREEEGHALLEVSIECLLPRAIIVGRRSLMVFPFRHGPCQDIFDILHSPGTLDRDLDSRPRDAADPSGPYRLAVVLDGMTRVWGILLPHFG